MSRASALQTARRLVGALILAALVGLTLGLFFKPEPRPRVVPPSPADLVRQKLQQIISLDVRDQRLEELEKEVTVFQQEIASLKADSTPEMKTVALTQPASNSADGLSPAPAADDEPKMSLAGLLGPVTLSGFGDVYYGYDYNHPGNNQSGLRFFEAPTNGFALNMAELILDKAPDATSPDSRPGPA